MKSILTKMNLKNPGQNEVSTILKNKKKLEDFKTVKLNEKCSAILLNKLPQKLKDLGSFTIPCTISSINFDKALCDLGANINLMPLSILQKLGLKEPTP